MDNECVDIPQDEPEPEPEYEWTWADRVFALCIFSALTWALIDLSAL